MVSVDGGALGASGPLYTLQPASQASRGVEEPAARLEVVRQGAWFGFRSATAGNRFLQVCLWGQATILQSSSASKMSHTLHMRSIRLCTGSSIEKAAFRPFRS